MKGLRYFRQPISLNKGPLKLSFVNEIHERKGTSLPEFTKFERISGLFVI